METLEARLIGAIGMGIIDPKMEQALAVCVAVAHTAAFRPDGSPAQHYFDNMLRQIGYHTTGKDFSEEHSEHYVFDQHEIELIQYMADSTDHYFVCVMAVVKLLKRMRLSVDSSLQQELDDYNEAIANMEEDLINDEQARLDFQVLSDHLMITENGQARQFGAAAPAA